MKNAFSNKEKREEIYPFGLQNDLGNVAGPISTTIKVESSARSSGLGCIHHPLTTLIPPAQTSVGDSGMVVSTSTHSLQSASVQHSRASSITDLSAEAELLERAICHNDVATVKRMLDLHHGRFMVNLHGSVMDKWSGDSMVSACLSQEVEILLRKSQTLLDRFHQQESVSEPETPSVFVNALHLAVEQRALDVTRLLLRYGVEPNEGGVAPATDPEKTTATRRGSNISDDILVTVSVKADRPLALSTVTRDGNGQPLTYSDVYTREVLYTLPALFLAVAIRSAEMVHVLLKYGAQPNVQDQYGCTPLHLAACQESVPWNCLVPLVENGAKMTLTNKAQVAPCHLLPELCKVQEVVMVDIFSALMPIHKNNNHNQGTGDGGRGLLFRRLHPDLRKANKGHESGPEDDACVGSGGDGGVHSTHLVATGRSYSLCNSTDGDQVKEPSPEGISAVIPRMGRERLSCKIKGKPSDGDQLEVGEVEKHLQALIKMASNSECTDMMLTELFNHSAGLIEMVDQLSKISVHRYVARLLNQLLQTIVSGKEERTVLHGLCTLLCLALALIQGAQALQYTALLTLNKVIDVSIVRRLTHTPVQLNPAFLPASARGTVEAPSEPPTPKPQPPQTLGPARRLLPLRKQTSCEVGQEETSQPGLPQETSLVGLLSQVHPGLLLNILHNAITLHKRVVGTKQQCTPSHRWRHCSYHCLQILSARVLLFMTQNTAVQSEIITEAQLRILVATLDSTNDPQLLCLVLQVVATLALDPVNHPMLTALDVPDALTQLILPSDEWYYTNHSTKFARFVKHHATRTLVYMGLHNRVAGRVYLFDLLDDPEVRPGDVGDGSENAYILATSLPPKVVRGNGDKIAAMSVESATEKLVKEIEEMTSTGTTEPTAPTSCFLHSFLCTHPAAIHPVIIFRLLVHRFVGTRPHHRGPRGSATSASVSRASSIDVEDVGVGDAQRRGLGYLGGLGPNTVVSVNPSLSISPTRGPRVFRSNSVKSTRGELRVVIDEHRCDDSETKGDDDEEESRGASRSPSIATKRPSRFASLRRKKSKSSASIATKSTLELSIEEDILKFQRQLQNLPRFEPAPDDQDPRFNRPRSRSVPKVTFEGSLFMPPPPPHSASFQRMGPPTPWGTDVPAPPPLTPQLSVEGVTAAGDMPPGHTVILKVMQTWASTCHTDLESLPLVRRDLREFLDRVESLGDAYEEWTQQMRFLVDTEEGDIGVAKDHDENVDDQYHQLQKLVVSGKLPCAKEEAVVLAGIQLRIEESCPSDRFSARQSHTIHSQLRPIVEDVKEAAHEVALMAHEVTNSDSAHGEGSRILASKLSEGTIASVAFPWRRGFLRHCMEKKKESIHPTIRLEVCIPPAYHGSKNILKLVKEQKRKLFHTSVYESEVQLKKLYVQSCQRLPAYGCQMYQVKELLRGHPKKKATRLLGIGVEKIVLLDSKTRLLARSQPTRELQQWRAGGGRSHDRLVLEFRGTKWSFVTLSATALKGISSDLWEIMQEIDNKFLEENVPQVKTNEEAVKSRQMLPPFPGRSAVYADELDRLQMFLNFPEEIALRLTETEYNLFYQVPAVAYVRHMTQDLSNTATQSPLHLLVKRFNEVSSWVTHIIISQPTHEDRLVVVSCILRVTMSCWNQGNFNGATEFLAGLKSEKLKPFWLVVHEKDEPFPIMDALCDVLLGQDTSTMYEEALERALAIPECKVVPFFGHFLRQLQSILVGTPSLIVLPPTNEQHLEFVSDFHGEDHFMTRIGTGGITNISKLDAVSEILQRIQQFHDHHQRLIDLRNSKKIYCSVYDLPSQPDGDTEYEVNPDLYQPIQPLGSEHGVSFIPLGHHPDLHTLQLLHHGCMVARWDGDSSRLSLVYLRLERSCSMITWSRSTWSDVRSPTLRDCFIHGRQEQTISPALVLRYVSGEVASLTIEEGFLELAYVKEVVRGRPEVDAVSAIRRLGFDGLALPDGNFSLVFGTNLSDNRVLDFIAPPHVASLWYMGLLEVVRSLHCQQRLSDQRLQWLREQYLQLYYEDGACAGPTPAEAIKVFGGRKWTLGCSSSSVAQSEVPPLSSFKRASSIGMNTGKFRKKKSQSASPPASRKDFETKISVVTGSEDPDADSPTTKSTFPSHTRLSREETSLATNTTLCLETAEKTGHFGNREKERKPSSVSIGGDAYGLRALSITHATQLDFVDFLDLFRAFSLRTRKDLKDLFEQFATVSKAATNATESATTDGNSEVVDQRHHGLLTRMKAESAAESHRRKICDAIAVASIVANCAGLDTTASAAMALEDFRLFLATHQGEQLSEDDILALMRRHEPDAVLQDQKCISFEGFAQYLMDKDNYAFTREMAPPVDDMDHPLSHYYVASSHNTYLTGHQLKGESSVELYSQVLLTGCRCVELDCWDGDDGLPLIYHGHTLTTKIPFKNVVEAINKSAFVTSSYPIILSVENHCSLQQQTRMAHIFLSVFGDRLVTRYLFESDFSDDPQLPSPNQLKNRVLIKNKKLVAEPTSVIPMRHKQSKSTSTRTNSIVSTESTASLDDDDFDEDDDEDEDDDDEYDELDEREVGAAESPVGSQEEKQSIASRGTSAGMRTESMSSQEGSIREKAVSPRPRSQSDLEWFLDEVGAAASKHAKKQSSQIAQELSDLIIYTQAIKFQGPTSPSSSVKARKEGAVKRALLPATMGTLAGTPPLGTECRLESTAQPGGIRRQPSTATCYQVSSLNENTTKKLCRKHALPLLAHTERHLMRTYPAGIRIDSSNFNPVIFWAFGIQMVALNYQTEDTALHLNTAMFEQNGQCGYVLKPRLMWDPSHVMYRRFNPWDKEFDGLHATSFSLTVVSGQYVCHNNHSGSPQVEVEMMGIPVDCSKQKTRIVQRNALNPIWNDSFNFTVMFCDLAFLRFIVTDVITGHITAQRIVPLHCMRPGYRHLRLRGPQNQPLPLSTLFIYSRVEEEGIENSRDGPDGSAGSGQTPDFAGQDRKEISGPMKRRIFFLRVYGVLPDELYTIIKVSKESTTRDVILQALAKSSKTCTRLYDHVLIEEVQQAGWSSERGTVQRILDMDEKPLEAQDSWHGEGRFILKRTGNDPSSRAWMSSILVSSLNEKRRMRSEWEEEEATFLVCIHNVSPEIPYAILRAPLVSTAQDIITQALVKARRMEDPTKLVLVEELDLSHPTSEGASSGKRRSHQADSRVLPDTEKVYDAQRAWKTTGRFTLKERAQVILEQKKTPPLRYPSFGNRRHRRDRHSSGDLHNRDNCLCPGDTGSQTSSDRKSPARLKLPSLRKLWVWR